MIDNADAFLSYLRKEYDSGNITAEQVLQKISSMLVIATAGVGLNTPKHGWLYEALHKATSGKLETQDEKLGLGIFIQALIDHGASRKQALQATADWLVISETKVRQAHEYFRIWDKKQAELPFIEEMKRFSVQETLKAKKEYPTTFPKAHSAYLLLKDNYN